MIPPRKTWAQHLPLAIGLMGGGLLLINRLAFTPDLLTSQSRSDALGILLSALLILTGLLWQQVQPPLPVSVTLEGVAGFESSPTLTAAQLLDLAWASHTLLTVTATRSLVIWWDSQVVLRRGILIPLPADALPWPLEPGSVMRRVLQNQRPVYLVDLKLFPAKQEFTRVLPSNSQAILCQPIGTEGLLILATDTPRSFTPRDQEWIEALAQRLDPILSGEA